MTRRAKISLSTAFLVCLTLVGVISVFCVGYLWIHASQGYFAEESHQMRESYLTARKTILKREVERVLAFAEYMKSQTESRLKSTIRDRVYEAHAIAAHLYAQNRDRPRAELASLVKEALRPIRFNKGRGYYFSFNMQGVETLFADRPEMEGKNMLNVRGGNGELVVADVLAMMRHRKEGFYSYTWTKPNEKGHFPKIAFVKYFQPLDWVIGTGEYLDDVKTDIQQEVLQWIDKIKFENESRIFAGQWNGVRLSGPDSGPNRPGLLDSNGVEVSKALIKAAQAGGGYVDYFSPASEGRREGPKLCYVVGIEEWKWYLAVEVYVDDIETAVARKQALLDQKVSDQIYSTVFVLASILVLVLVSVRFLSLRIRRNLSSLTSFLDDAAEKNAMIDHQSLHFSEFSGLAVSANEMIEKRTQMENALKESRAWLRSILDAIQCGVMVIDADNRCILDVNQAAARMLGTPHDEVIGQPCSKFFFPAEETNGSDIEIGPNVTQTERKLVRPDGSSLPVLRSSSRLQIADKQYIIKTFSDLSGQKTLEEQLRQANKMEALGLLAGGVAHDLNNRLSPVIGFCELLLEDSELNADQRQQLDQILDAGLKARDLVHQLLAFGRKQALSINAIEINDLINGMQMLLRRTIPEDIEFEFLLTPDKPLINADAGQMEQVILNLTLNARDAMPNGGRLKVETRLVCLDENDPKIQDGMKPGRYVQLVISDSGCGIDAETIQRIFDPFFTTKEKGKGTGLGLAMVYGIIKQHGGCIRVTSTLGSGSSFKVYLPLVETGREARAVSAAAAENLHGTETIMVVEDDEIVRTLTSTILNKHGYRVLSASGALECLDQLESLQGRLDLVLTDVVMPKVNGKELSDMIRASYTDVKILFMSGYTNRIIAHHGVMENELHFLQKPFTSQGLIQKVREVLDCAILN